MELHYEKLDKNLYVLDDFFSMDEFMPLNDELHGMYHTFMWKREQHVSKDKPTWLGLNKKSTYGLGDNMVFLERATKIRWAISKILKPDFSFKLKRVNTNLQSPFQDSSFHRDSYRVSDESMERYWGWTFIAFTQTEWDFEWGGEFVCQLGDKDYRSVSYIPNRCVLFNGDCYHRGSAPNIFAQDVRTSVAWTFVSENTNIDANSTSRL